MMLQVRQEECLRIGYQFCSLKRPTTDSEGSPNSGVEPYNTDCTNQHISEVRRDLDIPDSRSKGAPARFMLKPFHIALINWEMSHNMTVPVEQETFAITSTDNPKTVQSSLL